VKAAALRSGAHPKPPALDPMQQKMVAELRHARGSDRDRLYVEQQKKAHGMALSLHQDYAASGSDPALRHAASEIVPVVQEHIAKLAAMPM
jgi:putative membrane protein